MLALAMVAQLASAQAARAPAFKGGWQGPSKQILPGPGPKPGQSLADYFEHLASGDRHPARLHVLVLGGTRGFHHDSVPAAMNAIYEAGRRTALWDTEFATDFALLNVRGGKPMHAGFQPQGLGDFDAVVVASASGDWDLSADQKAALLAFVHEAGKGIVVMHAGMDANHGWRDYLDMIGAEMTGHPFNTVEKVLVPFPIVNESRDFPATRHLPAEFRKQDELYVVRNWLRSEVNVLLRLDATRLDYDAYPDLATQLPPDHDFPIAWTKRYGKGRVFVSSLGHPAEAFDDPDIVQMYAEAVKWALGLSEGDEAPHPAR
jgi:type 1 glutamine amidotransferase